MKPVGLRFAFLTFVVSLNAIGEPNSVCPDLIREESSSRLGALHRSPRTTLDFTDTNRAQSYAVFIEDDGARVIQKTTIEHTGRSWFADFTVTTYHPDGRVSVAGPFRRPAREPISEETIATANKLKYGARHAAWSDELRAFGKKYPLTALEINAAFRAGHTRSGLTEQASRLLVMSYATVISESAMRAAERAVENLTGNFEEVRGRLNGSILPDPAATPLFLPSALLELFDALYTVRKYGFHAEALVAQQRLDRVLDSHQLVGN